MKEPGLESVKIAAPNAEAVRAELDAVLNSAAFKRSERHSKFLRFVCEMTLEGEALKLNEYLIAHTVFGRGEDYSPGDDSVVRRQAYSLRQKLQEYYSNEGAKDPLRIELPIGRYIPNFLMATPQQHPPSLVEEEMVDLPVLTDPVSPTIPAPAVRSISLALVLISVVAAAAVAFALGWILHSPPKGIATDAAMAELWGPWLTDPQGAFLCFSNPLTTVVKQVPTPYLDDSSPRSVRLTEPQAEEFRRQLDLSPGGYVYVYPGIGHAKMGEALGSISVAALLTKAGVPVRATQSRFINWEDFRTKNLILMGHDEANRWLDPILSKLPFRLAPTQSDKRRRIVNTSPRDHEHAEYSPDSATTSTHRPEDYALISMVSGLDDRHRLLLINGVNSEGTQVAEEFLTDPVSVRRLLAKLHAAEPGHKGVWHFQVLLYTEVRGNIPTRVDIVAIRVL